MAKQTGNRSAEIPVKFEQGWLDMLDGRTNLAQNLRLRYDEVCGDLGGTDSLSYFQRSLIERSLWLEYWLSKQERELAEGTTEFDVGKWVQAVNSLQGIFSRLGLHRQAKPVQSLESYLHSKQAAQA